MRELNDSVSYLPGEGMLIMLDNENHHGFYNKLGIQHLILEGRKLARDTTELENALTCLKLYDKLVVLPVNEL